MNPSQRLPMSDYFILEAASAVAGCQFLLCVAFWARMRFGFTDAENLLLLATHGLVYIFAAKHGGRLADRVGYDWMLAFCFLGMAAVMLLGWLPVWTWRSTPFIVVFLYTLGIGPIWPSFEAAILHSPGSITMPNRLGIYNVAWGFGDGLGFFISGLLFGWSPDSILWVTGLFHLAQLAWLKIRPSRGPTRGETAMEMPHRGDQVPRPVKRRFMHMAWLGNSLGFLMNAVFIALTPQMAERLHMIPRFTIWLACAPLFGRALGFLIFWKWEGWHYHALWSLAALWLAPVFLAVVFFSNSVGIILPALCLFGLVPALSYSGSLYYSLDYGENKGEHGGLHESILGMGAFAGPLIGAAAAWFSSTTHGAVAAQWTVIGFSLLLTGGGLAWIRKA